MGEFIILLKLLLYVYTSLEHLELMNKNRLYVRKTETTRHVDYVASYQQLSLIKTNLKPVRKHIMLD